MKKLTIIATALLLSTQATAQTHTINQEYMIGCKSKSTYDQLQSYVSDGDETAFNRAYAMNVMQDQCTMFEEGVKVFVADTTWTRVKVRREGETSSYWTMIEAVF